MNDEFETCEGGCTCGQVRYRMPLKPLIVHCCHCTWCQRQTGTAFAVNALVEADRVKITKGEIENTTLATPSGFGQRFARCPTCKVAVWSEYLHGTDGVEDVMYFIRVGTLDNPACVPPDVHIYTSTKQSWIILPPEVLAVEEFYDWNATLSEESLNRHKELKARMKERAN